MLYFYLSIILCIPSNQQLVLLHPKSDTHIFQGSDMFSTDGLVRHGAAIRKEMVSGKWRFSVPSGALTTNQSFNNFKEQYAGHGSPLHVRGSGCLNDVSPPDFIDWLVHLSDDLPLSELCIDSSKAEADIAAEVQELRKEGQLYCPEGHTCKHGYHHHRRFCLECQVPVCTTCRLCLSQNMKSPVSLANDNWIGYVQDWVYEQEVTWMEKTVASPHWTGFTVFTIGAKRPGAHQDKATFDARPEVFS